MQLTMSVLRVRQVGGTPSSCARRGWARPCGSAATSTPHKRSGHVAGSGARGRSRKAEVELGREVGLARKGGKQKEVEKGLWWREAHEWQV